MTAEVAQTIKVHDTLTLQPGLGCQDKLSHTSGSIQFAPHRMWPLH